MRLPKPCSTTLKKSLSGGTNGGGINPGPPIQSPKEFKNVRSIPIYPLNLLIEFVVPNSLAIRPLGLIPTMQVPQVVLELLGHVHNLLDVAFAQYNLSVFVSDVVEIREGDCRLEGCDMGLELALSPPFLPLIFSDKVGKVKATYRFEFPSRSTSDSPLRVRSYRVSSLLGRAWHSYDPWPAY